MKIKTKLIICFLGIGLIPMIFATLFAIREFGQQVQVDKDNMFYSINVLKKNDVEVTLNVLKRDLEALATSPSTITAYKELVRYHNTPGLGPVEPLKDPYDVSTPEYKAIWEEYGKPIIAFANGYGYDEIYMICKPHGHVMYSIKKNADMGQNLRAGELKDTALAEIWAKISESGKPEAVDFRPYGPLKGEWTGFIGAPIKEGEKILGLMVFQIPQKKLETVVSMREGMGKTGTSFIAGKTNDVVSLRTTIPTVTDRDESVRIGKVMENRDIQGAFDTEQTSGVMKNFFGHDVLYNALSLKYLGLDWTVFSLQDTDEVYESITSFQNISLITGLVFAGVIMVLAFFIAMGIAGPIRAMTEVMLKLAGGNKNVTVPYTDKSDETGDMSKAVQTFKDNALKMDALAEEHRQAEVAAERKRRQEMLDMADGFEKQVGGIASTVASAATEMEATASSMAGTAERASHQANMGANASQSADQSVQTVAAAAEELNSSIGAIMHQVETSSQIAHNAVADAQVTSETMNRLTVSAQKIGEVVNLITDIASQTNLLALNATIEAARAGDAGKGFAVVANEVKHLANQTAKATEDISSQIEEIQRVANEAVTAIQKIQSTITEMNEISSATQESVTQQGQATQEISRSVQLAAQGTAEVSENISGVSSAVDQTGQAAGDVRQAAQELAVQGDNLVRAVHSFLDTIRSENRLDR